MALQRKELREHIFLTVPGSHAETLHDRPPSLVNPVETKQKEKTWLPLRDE